MIFAKYLALLCFFITGLSQATQQADPEYFASSIRNRMIRVKIQAVIGAERQAVSEYLRAHEKNDAVKIVSESLARTENGPGEWEVQVRGRVDFLTRFFMDIANLTEHATFKMPNHEPGLYPDVEKFKFQSSSITQPEQETARAIRFLLQNGVLPYRFEDAARFEFAVYNESGAIAVLIEQMRSQGFLISEEKPSVPSSLLLQQVLRPAAKRDHQILIKFHKGADIEKEVKKIRQRYSELGMPKFYKSMNLVIFDVSINPSRVERAIRNLSKWKAISQVEFQRGPSEEAQPLDDKAKVDIRTLVEGREINIDYFNSDAREKVVTLEILRVNASQADTLDTYLAEVKAEVLTRETLAGKVSYSVHTSGRVEQLAQFLLDIQKISPTVRFADPYMPGDDMTVKSYAITTSKDQFEIKPALLAALRHGVLPTGFIVADKALYFTADIQTSHVNIAILQEELKSARYFASENPVRHPLIPRGMVEQADVAKPSQLNERRFVLMIHEKAKDMDFQKAVLEVKKIKGLRIEKEVESLWMIGVIVEEGFDLKAMEETLQKLSFVKTIIREPSPGVVQSNSQVPDRPTAFPKVNEDRILLIVLKRDAPQGHYEKLRAFLEKTDGVRIIGGQPQLGILQIELVPQVNSDALQKQIVEFSYIESITSNKPATLNSAERESSNFERLEKAVLSDPIARQGYLAASCQMYFAR